MAKLDKNREYGEVFGTGTEAKFYQDGEHFTAAGKHIPSMSGKQKPKTRAKPKPKLKPVVKDTEGLTLDSGLL